MVRTIFCGASLLAIVAAAMPAQAQERPQGAPPSASGEDDAIVVTGIRANNRNVIQAKRQSEVIADSVSADEIGALPDFNVAEALQRVPGISTDQDNGEDRFVVVRGLRSEFNFTAVDGLTLPSTDAGSRQILFDVVPSSAVARIDVLKSFTADIDGQAIGGSLNLITRSAFKQRRNFFSLDAAYGFMDYRDQGPDNVGPSYRFDGTYSTKFGSDNQFGILVSGSYFKRDTYVISPTNSGTAPFYFYDANQKPLTGQVTNADVLSSAFIVPENSTLFLYHSDRSRFGGIAKLEYQSPGGAVQAYLQGFYFKRIDDERRDQFRYRNRAGNVVPVNLTPTSGTVVGRTDPVFDLVDQNFNDTTKALQFGADLQLADRHSLKVKIGYSTGKARNPESNAAFVAINAQGEPFSYTTDPKDGFLIITPAATNVLNPTGFRLFRTAFEEEQNDESIMEFRVDYAFNADKGSQGFGLKIGGTYRDFERDRDVERAEYQPRSNVRILMSDFVLADTYANSPNFTVPIQFIDPAIFTAFDYPRDSRFPLLATSLRASRDADYSLAERVAALYAMGVYNGPNWRATAGFRFEDTHVRATANQLLAGVFVPFTANSSYSNWLPRADLTYDFTESLRLRLAYSRSLGRPDYVDLAPFRSVTINTIEGFVSVVGGNPAVKPRVSDNFDASLEYYLPNFDGLISIGLFHKNIKDDIFTLGSTVANATFDGLTGIELRLRQPANADSAKLTGFEAGLILNRLDFLPAGPWRNFGIAANYAYVTSSARFSFVNSVNGTDVNASRDVPLFLQPSHIANASIFYKQGWFEAKLSYNYKGRHLRAILDDDVPWTDRYYAPRSRLDAQLRIELAKGIRLTLEGKNLTRSYAQEIFNFGAHHTKRDSGREFWLGTTFRL